MLDLPVIPVSTHRFIHPLLKKPIKYKAYVVGQESILIQNKDQSDADKLNAIRQVLEQCTDGIDVDKLAFPILEMLFVQIREKSAGETIPVTYRCANKIKDAECNERIAFDINLQDVTLEQPDGFSDTIVLDEGTGIGVKMAMPTIETYESLGEDVSFQDMVVHCIECIFQGDQVFSAAERSTEDLIAWWGTLTTANKMKVINQFFMKMPHIHYQHTHKCTKCNHVHEFKYTKLKHFFS